MHRWLLLLVLVFGACDDSAELPDNEGLYEEGPALFDGSGKSDTLGFDAPAYGPLPQDSVLDGSLQVLFAPDDPVNTVELSFIERVIQARQADPAEYVEGENPYRIRYAVYNLRNVSLVDGLMRAHDAGVDVQILIESAQLDPAKEYNTTDETLIEHGFEFHPDHRQLTESERVTGDLIGIGGSGLMHLKTRIFETPDSTTVLTGSMNPGDNAVVNEEALHIIQDPELVAKYIDTYERVLRGERLVNSWNEGAAVNVMFTPVRTGTRAVEKIFDWIVEEDEQILLMVFSLRNIGAPNHPDSLVNLLAKKKREGVPVVIITDRKQSDGVDANGNFFMRNDNTEDLLRQAGIPVYEATNRTTPFTAMHHKTAILGRTNIRVITDAANWTAAGLGNARRIARNEESVLFIDSAKLDNNRTGKRYLAQWVRVLSRYAHQSLDDGETEFEDMFRALIAQNGWPAQDTRFVLHVSSTRLGESVFVRGDQEILGFWNSGLMASTTAETFPIWTADADFPLAQRIEYKLTIDTDGRNPRWQEGDNRVGFAQPAPLHVEDIARIQAEW